MTARKKGRRRGSGEGSVYKSPDGRWRGAVDLGWEDGKRQRRYVSGRSQQEALAELRKAREAAEMGVRAEGTMTVERWLNHWLDVVVANSARVKSMNTVDNYRHATAHLITGLGKVKLDKLTAQHVDRFLAAKADEGYSASYVGRMRTVLGAALRHAEKRHLVPRNVALVSDMPNAKAANERRSLTHNEVRSLLAAAEGDRLEALFNIGLAVGPRPGELAGLLWSDVDLDAGTLSISGSMKRRPGGQPVRGAVKKASAGERTVQLPATAVRALRAQRKRVAEERLAAGQLWHDHGLVFATEIGTPWDPTNMRRAFAKVARRAGIKDGFPYMMRHTFVSLALDAGATIEQVADVIGDDPRTLYRHYRHRVRPVAAAGTLMESVLAAR